MALTWTDDMGNLAFELVLEQPTRAAALAAVAFAAALPADRRPVFDGDMVIAPRNDSAKALLVALAAHVPAGVVGGRRMAIIAAAVAVMRARLAQPSDEAFIDVMTKQTFEPSHGRPKQTPRPAGRR
jgi:hypothetical protein